MKYNELVLWAKNHGYIVEKKSANIISWHKKDEPDRCGSSDNKNQIATDIYNNITDGTWVEYQREEAARKASQEVFIKPPE